MITLFVIGIILLVVKLIFFVFKAAMGLVKGILVVALFPAALVVLCLCGLMYLALPLLIAALVLGLIFSLLKRI